MIWNASTQIVEKITVEYQVPASLWSYMYLQGYAEPASSLRYISNISTYLQYPYNDGRYFGQCIAMLIQYQGYSSITSSGSYNNVFLPQYESEGYGYIWAIKLERTAFVAACKTLSGNTVSSTTSEISITAGGGGSYLDLSAKVGNAAAYFAVPANCSIIVNLYRAISAT